MTDYRTDQIRHAAEQIVRASEKLLADCDAAPPGPNIEDARQIAILASDIISFLAVYEGGAWCDDCIRSGTCPCEGTVPCALFVSRRDYAA